MASWQKLPAATVTAVPLQSGAVPLGLSRNGVGKVTAASARGWLPMLLSRMASGALVVPGLVVGKASAPAAVLTVRTALLPVSARRRLPRPSSVTPRGAFRVAAVELPPLPV